MRRRVVGALFAVALASGCGGEQNAGESTASEDNDASGRFESLGRSATGDARNPAERASSSHPALHTADPVLAVGARAPAVPGVTRRHRTVLVFFRGEWWAACRAQLGELQANLGRFEAAGARVVAVSGERPLNLERLRRTLGLAFPIVHDDGLALARAYGVREDVQESTADRRRVAVPSVFVVGTDGLVHYAHVGKTAYDRPSIADLLEAVDAQPEAARPSEE